MAKDHIEPCKYYVCEGQCSKGREATHKSYCQKCSKYEPRVRKKHLNLKKQKLQNLRLKEKFE